MSECSSLLSRKETQQTILSCKGAEDVGMHLPRRQLKKRDRMMPSEIEQMILSAELDVEAGGSAYPRAWLVMWAKELLADHGQVCKVGEHTKSS